MVHALIHMHQLLQLCPMYNSQAVYRRFVDPCFDGVDDSFAFTLLTQQK